MLLCFTSFHQASKPPEAERAGHVGQGGVVHLHGKERHRGDRLPAHRRSSRPRYRGVHARAGELHVHSHRCRE